MSMDLNKVAELTRLYEQAKRNRDVLLQDTDLDDEEKESLQKLNTELDQLFTKIVDVTRE